MELDEFEQKRQVIRKIVEFCNNKRAEKKYISAVLWEVKVNLLAEM